MRLADSPSTTAARLRATPVSEPGPVIVPLPPVRPAGIEQNGRRWEFAAPRNEKNPPSTGPVTVRIGALNIELRAPAPAVNVPAPEHRAVAPVASGAGTPNLLRRSYLRL
jgi:hypothetical protein